MTQSEERMTRLEEALAFSERAIEEMHGEIVSLQRRFEGLTARLARAEASRAQRGEPTKEPREEGTAQDIELPPHAHRPVDRSAGRTTDPFAPTTPPPEGLTP